MATFSVGMLFVLRCVINVCVIGVGFRRCEIILGFGRCIEQKFRQGCLELGLAFQSD